MIQAQVIRNSVILLLFATASAAMAQTSLTTPAGRISDPAIRADQEVYASTQMRLRRINEAGTPLSDERLAKAQCWLDVSFHEYSRNDRSDFPQRALTESVRLAEALETRSTAPLPEADFVTRSRSLRPDLWARLAAMRGGAGFDCAARHAACAEVELVHAANENEQLGWRHATPYVLIAEDAVDRAAKVMAQCATVAPAPVATREAPQRNLVLERIELSADALFAYKRSGLADMLPEGRAKLDEVIAKIAAHAALVEKMRVVGHTDRLGGTDYNDRLALRRAQTVADYLAKGGISVPIAVASMGKREQIKACEGNKRTPELIACLQPNRRVTIDITRARE